MAKLREVISGNIYAEDFLREDNQLCFALVELQGIWDRFGLFPRTLRRKRHLFFAMAFVTQTVSLIKALGEKEGKRLANRIVGAIKSSPEDVRALQVELATATHFLQSGLTVSFADASRSERFDLLVSGAGEADLEVECKFISQDKGKKVHRADLHEFYKLVVPHVDEYLAREGVNAIVEVVVPDRFPASQAGKFSISESVRAVLNGADLKANEFVSAIKVIQHDLEGVSALPSSKGLNRDLIDAITGTRNENALVRESRDGRKSILIVRSAKESALLSSIYETLSDSSKKQFTRTRPAMSVALFHGISIDGLVAIAGHDEGVDSLQVIASRLINRQPHLISVWFMSESELSGPEAGETRSGGAVYHFKNTNSPFWKEGYDLHISPMTLR